MCLSGKLAGIATIAILAVGVGRPALTAPLAAPWATRDVGGPTEKGSAEVGADGAWTIKGGGADIWETADQFFFAYQPIDGDVQITVKALGRPVETDEWAKAGLMIRETLEPGARHAMLVTTPQHGLAFQWRDTTGGESASPGASVIESDDLKTPIVLRLTRKGKVITAEYSTDDGKTFKSAGDALTFPADLPKTVYVGLAITAHEDSKLSEAKFSDLAVKRL
jgi:regulation of enolase protein 1 (concanavalin A-like superfamily)